MAFAKSPSTGYYGADGGVMPVFSFGAAKLAPSLLTGDSSHMTLWTSIVIHVVALALTIAANVVFFTHERSEGLDLYWTWAVVSIVSQCVAVVGTLLYTGFVKNALGMPNTLVLGFGLFFLSIVSSAKISFAHSGLPADSTENVLYNLAIVFQIFGMSSIIVNAICVAGGKGGL